MTGIGNAYDECFVGDAIDTSTWERSDGAVSGGFWLYEGCLGMPLLGGQLGWVGLICAGTRFWA